MMRAAPILALTLLAACQEEPPAGDAISVPSGRELSLIEIVTHAPGPSGAAARFRFLAPGLTQDDAVPASADMQALCDSFALPRIDGMVPAPQEIILSFSAGAVPFGEAAPDTVQFFESFSVATGTCVWEPY
jgi:hypothetical protein